MGVTADTYGGLLSSVLLSKIPQDIRLIVSRMLGDGDRKLDDLMKMLLDELQARERSAASDITLGKGRENLPSTASAPAGRRIGGHTHLLLLSTGTRVAFL